MNVPKWHVFPKSGFLKVILWSHCIMNFSSHSTSCSSFQLLEPDRLRVHYLVEWFPTKKHQKKNCLDYYFSCLNPIIYGFMSKSFRGSFKRSLSACSCTSGPSTGSRNHVWEERKNNRSFLFYKHHHILFNIYFHIKSVFVSQSDWMISIRFRGGGYSQFSQ